MYICVYILYLHPKGKGSNPGKNMIKRTGKLLKKT